MVLTVCLSVNGGDSTRRKELRQVDKSMGTLKVCKSDTCTEPQARCWQSDPRKELKKQISVNHDFGVQELVCPSGYAPAGFDGKPSDSKVKPVIY